MQAHIYESTEQLYAVMGDLFNYLSSNPQYIDDFLNAKMVVRIIFTDPDGVITVDGRTPPMEVFFGPMPGKADFEIQVQADLLHEIWMDRESLSKNFMAGNIKAKGNLFKLLGRMEDLFRGAERAYPDYVKQYNLE